MYFTRLELNNYGIFKGTHVIEPQNSILGRNITLIGGLNGRGKTTILEAIFLILFGKRAVRYLQDEHTNYSDYLLAHINKSCLNEKTSLELSLVLDEGEHTQLTIRRAWHQSGRGVVDSLTIYKDGNPDHYLSDNWDFYIEKILPLGIARFFFFDSEKISQIADDESYEKVKGSIKVLIGVSTIDKLIADVTKLMKTKRSTLSINENASFQAQHEEFQATHNEISAKIAKARQTAAGIVPRLERINNQLESHEMLFWQKGGNLSLNREQILAEKKLLQETMQSQRQQLIDLANRSSTPMLLCRSLLERTYNCIKTEEMAGNARYSGPILSNLQKSLTSHIRTILKDSSTGEALLSLVEKEFEEVSHSAMQPKKYNVTPASLSALDGLMTIGLQDIFEQCRTSLASAEFTDNQLTQLDIHINNDTDKADVLDLMDEIKNLTQQRGTLLSEQKHINDDIHSLEFQLKQVENHIFQLTRTMAANEQNNDESARIVKYATMTIEIMNEFKIRLQKNKVHDLEEEIYRCFKFMAQKETLISAVRIHPDTLDITLHDYQGGTLLKSQLSAGEKQIFAVATLWGLAKSSGYRLPVVIDTPMGRLDSIHRTNFVTKYLPHASDQVIVLSTDEEIYGPYFDQINNYVSSTYTLVYNIDNNSTSIVPGYFKE